MSSLTIDDAIGRVPEWRGLPNLPYERIAGGLTNQSYRVAVGTQRYVLRINAPNSGAMALDRNHEREVLLAAEAAGIGPEVIYCSPTEGVLVTRWIDGSPWTRGDIRKPRNIARLAARLHEIHALPRTRKSFDPAASIRTYAELIEGAHMTLPRQAVALWDRVKAYNADAMAVTHLCHNDIVHSNIIDTGCLRILDWEYAAMGDPIFELATVTRYHHFSARQADELLRCYAGEPSNALRDRLKRMQTVFDTLHLFWLLAQKATSGTATRIDERIGALLGNLENPPLSPLCKHSDSCRVKG